MAATVLGEADTGALDLAVARGATELRDQFDDLRGPVAPIGCPRLISPPLTLTGCRPPRAVAPERTGGRRRLPGSHSPISS